MKRLASRHGLLVGILIALLTALFFNGRDRSAATHEQLTAALHEIIATNARLNQDLLRSRTGLLRNYDGINRHVDALARLTGDLQSLLQEAFDDDSPELDRALSGLATAIADKGELVEQFKSANAVYQNSLMYLTTASRQLSESATGATQPRLATLLGALSNRVMLLNRGVATDVTGDITNVIAQLRRLPLDRATRQTTDSLVRHTELILAHGPEADRLLQELLGHPVYQRTEAINGFYLGLHRKETAQAQLFRALSYLVSVVLVLYVLYLFLRLRRGTRALGRANAALAAEKDRAQITLRSIGEGVITTDESGMVRYLNPVAAQLTGTPIDDAIGKPLTSVLHLTADPEAADAPDNALSAGNIHERLPQREQAALIARDGRSHIIDITASPMRDQNEAAIGTVIVFRDVTETQRLMRHISYQAKHDALTGLVNRREFEDRLQLALTSARRDGRQHALCYLDLDQFKIVNDTHGHIAGDELLKQISMLIQGRLRETDTLARLGGDEFGVLLDNCPLERAETIAEDLRTLIQQFRFAWKDQWFDIGVSIGLVPITASSPDTIQLLSRADVACYAAKDLGRNRIHVHQEQDEEMARRHGELRWVNRIKRALEEDRFALYLQPIYDVRRAQPSGHYEFLLRYIDENGKIVLPGAFIPAAERYGLMGAVDRWVIEHALQFLARHHRRLPGPNGSARVSINLSGHSVTDESLKEFILDQIRVHRLPPLTVCFEITETSAIANLNQAVNLITSLREQGIQFLLDDFGSGLSSFAYLKTLPVDYLKIDGAFVRDMINDPIDHAMVDAINHIGHVMGKATVAECVEDDEVLDRLRVLGVDYAQGYAIGRPQPADEFIVTAPAGGTSRS